MVVEFPVWNEGAVGGCLWIVFRIALEDEGLRLTGVAIALAAASFGRGSQTRISTISPTASGVLLEYCDALLPL